jgi:hypothetical protein
MRHNIMKEHKGEIEAYCIGNRLSAERVFSFPKSFNDEFVAVLYVNPDPDNGRDGLRVGCAVPAPVVLWIRKSGDGVTFEQTEHTMKHLAI